MKVDAFCYLWEQGIVKAAQNVIREIAAEHIEKYKVELDVSDEMFKIVYREYDEFRLQVREKFFICF